MNNYCRFLTLLLAISIMMWSDYSRADEQSEQLLSIQNKILSARKNIQRYDLEVKIIQKERDTTFDHHFYIRKDGDKFYYEHTNAKPVSSRSIVCKDGDASGYTFRYNYLAEGTVNSGRYDRGGLTKEDRIFDPILLGLVNGTLFEVKRVTLDTALGELFTTKPTTITQEVLSDKKCLKFEYLMPESVYRIWLDENSYNLLKHESIREDKYGKLSRVTTVNVEKFNDEIWFPTSVHYVETFNGKKSVDFQADIIVHSLNNPVDPARFSRQSMQLPVGARIFYDPLGRSGGASYVNENNELVPPDTFRKPEPEPKEPSKWWGRVAVAACVLTLIFGFIYLRQRRLKAKSS
jgi:type II secretory pathway pseudopilin PulG